jgi:hypothetical protein
VAVTGETNLNYEREVAEMSAVLQQHHGFLVLYPAAFGVPSSGDTAHFTLWSKLVLVGAYSDGSIYQVLPRTT